MCRPYRPEDRGNIAIPRPNDLGYYVTALQALLGCSKIYIYRTPYLQGQNVYYIQTQR